MSEATPRTDSRALLEVRDLHVYYGRSHVLQGVDLCIGTNEPVAVIGRNGMGKTTLCNAIMGLLPAAAGEIVFDGVDLLSGPRSWSNPRSWAGDLELAAHDRARLGIGYVPQGRRIFPSLTVDEHLRLVRRGNGSGRWTVSSVYDLFPTLASRRSSYADRLSGGEQQMLAIGRALLLNPRLLVMDEPSEGLAPVIVEQLEDVLRDLAAEEIGLLLVEQNLAVATTVADSLAVMVRGEIALETTSDQMLSDASAQQRYLGVGSHLIPDREEE